MTKRQTNLTLSSQGAGATGFTVGAAASADFFRNIFFPSVNKNGTVQKNIITSLK